MRCNCVSNFTWHNIAKLYKNQKKISLKFHSHTIWCFLPACLFYDVSDGTFSTDTENKKKPTASYCVRFCPPQKLSHRWEIFFWADLFLESWITALESQPSWLLLHYVVYTQRIFVFWWYETVASCTLSTFPFAVEKRRKWAYDLELAR